jgi:hypothetical protein
MATLGVRSIATRSRTALHSSIEARKCSRASVLLIVSEEAWVVNAVSAAGVDADVEVAAVVDRVVIGIYLPREMIAAPVVAPYPMMEILE